MPRCCAHSPTASTPGRLVFIASSTMIPRSQTSPIERASSVSGRMPIETTTRSAMSSVPSLKRRPWARSGPMICCVLRSNSTSMSRPCRAGASRALAPASSWRSMSRSSRCTTVTAQPCAAMPRAASRPSRPPPMTAARATPPAAAATRIASQSAGSRKGCTPASVIPGIGGMSGWEPVARTSLPNASSSTSSRPSTPRWVSTQVTVRPRSSSTPWSAYHSGGRSCSVSGSSPLTRISDSRTRS